MITPFVKYHRNEINNCNIKNIYYNVDIGMEGIGSMFQHLKTGIILSIYFNTNFSLFRHKTNHGYVINIGEENIGNNSFILNNKLNLSNICESIFYEKQEDNNSLDELEYLCDYDEIIINFKETIVDYNDCIKYKYIEFINNFNINLKIYNHYINLILNNRKNDIINIGVHIRFGDVKSNSIDKLNFRNINKNYLIDLFEILDDSKLKFHLFIFMEDYNDKILLIKSNFIIVDNDSFTDLKIYSEMDICIQGDSNYAILGSIIGSTNKIIVTDKINSEKYNWKFNKNMPRLMHISNFLMEIKR